uniref:Peptidase A1 domain-containing protein n=1 Tax=Bursaphelenchus xylophilus TaxID=6326 RepID=A0A1I7RQR6_BURXY
MDVCHFAILLYFVAAVLGDQSKGSNKPVFIAPALGKTYLRAQLDLNRPYSVFLHDDCKAAKCSAVVDGVTTYKPSAKELKEFKDDKKYGNYELQGKWYRETLTLEIEFTVNVVAATSANPQVPWLYSGVLGLAPARDSEDEQSSIIKKLLNAESLSAKQLVIQESWKELAKKNKEMKGDADASGLIAIGNLESGRCGSFTTANTDQKSWTFEADIKIGDEKFEKKKIAFMVGQNGVAEDAIFDKHFARTYDKDTELPTISFNVSSTTFELAGKEYGEYNATLGPLQRAQRYYICKYLLEYFTKHPVIFRVKIGLGRDPDNKNFVQMLYDKGHIEEEKVAMVFPPYSGIMVFGKSNIHGCGPKWNEVKVCGTREWMFEAIKVSFFDYTSEHNYKVILIENELKMPKHVLVRFINDGFLVPFETDVRGNVYSVNTTGRNDLKYEFVVNSNLTLHINESSLNAGPYTTLETLSATGIDSNPDNVEWMFGSMVLREYCVQLDYKNNMLGFARLSQDESEKMRLINQKT